MLHYHSQDTASFKPFYKNLNFIKLKVIGQVTPLIYFILPLDLVKCSFFTFFFWGENK